MSEKKGQLVEISLIPYWRYLRYFYCISRQIVAALKITCYLVNVSLLLKEGIILTLLS